MLIEFSVANFRSIRERQTLSLVASNREQDLPANTIPLDSPGLADTKLLKSAVIYGANASGKSNLIKAARFMQRFVENSASRLKPGEATGVAPFRLDAESRKQPSEFEALFLHDGVRYQYGFKLDAQRVREEWLTAYPHGRPQKWFRRHCDLEGNRFKYEFGPNLTGNKKQISEMTRENSLYLSVAAQFSHDMLRTVYQWMSKHVSVIDCSEELPHDALGSEACFVEENSKEIQAISRAMCEADFGIQEIRPLNHGSAPGMASAKIEDLSPEDLDAIFHLKDLDRLDNDQFSWFGWRHFNQETGQAVDFDDADESVGTLKFVSLLVPLLQSLRDGRTLFVDEIAAFMHPMLVRNLIKMFHSEETNPRSAQMVLTTHDVTLLDTSLFRRDQVWFTEKKRNGATELYPLTDFKPRKGEALQKGYLAGRYGGIPFLKGDFAL